ncbi:hypothetical protein ZIOFF_023907 [Zingiber officinale]|uniref:Uncharacterized protein n=1 Tax=Zingiber officinale TaxID=94328 RepID=A0A8J5HB92_ZINOF|nr:hypothetical protein ZIOFF_023907 [Zingiber officinale]
MLSFRQHNSKGCRLCWIFLHDDVLSSRQVANLMGAQHSTRLHSLAVADAGTDGGDGHTHLLCLAELMSYEEACRLDPELETFDSMI